jgi:hypothetical protein
VRKPQVTLVAEAALSSRGVQVQAFRADEESTSANALALGEVTPPIDTRNPQLLYNERIFRCAALLSALADGKIITS